MYNVPENKRELICSNCLKGHKSYMETKKCCIDKKCLHCGSVGNFDENTNYESRHKLESGFCKWCISRILEQKKDNIISEIKGENQPTIYDLDFTLMSKKTINTLKRLYWRSGQQPFLSIYTNMHYNDFVKLTNFGMDALDETIVAFEAKGLKLHDSVYENKHRFVKDKQKYNSIRCNY